MAEDTHRSSRNYGLAQTVLLFAFAAAFFLDRGPRLIGPDRILGPIGSALSIAGLVLMLMAIVALRAVIQVAPEPRAGGHLVTRGVYRRFRHPIYTGILVVVLGLLLRKPTLLVALLAGVVFVFLVVKTQYEERLLLDRYADYAEYRTRTWGLIPWPGAGARGAQEPPR